MYRRFLTRGMLAYAGFALGLAGPAAAQSDYPSKPVQIVVAVSAGGSIDAVARNLAEYLSKAMGEPFIVNNRPGASGIIGTDHVARSAPDGYTLSMAPDAFIAANVSMFANLPYDPLKDFAPVSMVVDQPLVLVVNQDSPFKSVQDLVKYAKAHPGTVTYGSGGEGSPHHFSGISLGELADIELLHVPYKGGAPAITDLLGGHLGMIFSPLPEALPHVRGGKLRALAVTSPQRVAQLPDVPTLTESGVPMALTAWIALVAPAGTPPAVVSKLNQEVNKALTGPLRQTLEEVGFIVSPSTPEQLGQAIRDAIQSYGALAKAAGIKPQQ
ncbi:MAG: tripartite tricarboxylate transporter substrate binding protein [Pigmentiphaga sp.]|nr:tripartite tricarboxylate transporter substrate binding protein [Pigmentiphaga sp.]